MTATLTRPKVTDVAAFQCRVIDLEWPEEHAKTIGGAYRELTEALNLHDALRRGSVHWESQYPGLHTEYDDPHAEALGRAEDEVKEYANRLADAVAGALGDEAAAQAVRGGNGETR